MHSWLRGGSEDIREARGKGREEGEAARYAIITCDLTGVLCHVVECLQADAPPKCLLPLPLTFPATPKAPILAGRARAGSMPPRGYV